MSLVVLCPTRSRPDNAAACHRSFLDTRHATDSELIFVLDEDDDLDGYSGLPQIVVASSGRRGMTDPLNTALSQVWEKHDIVGFVGDDHRFRTSGWDIIFADQLRASGPGLIYANDLARADIPTQVFGSSIIWQALGWMALPPCRHLYLDNAWSFVGEGIERFYYFPDVVIEHMHPTMGKSEWDEQYRQLNASATYQEDGAAFQEWINSGQAQLDVERVRAAI